MLQAKLYQKIPSLFLASVAVLSLAFTAGSTAQATTLSPDEDHYALKLLGKFVFVDDISVPSRQSCASCHFPTTGGTNENSRVNLTVVAVPGADFHVSGSLKPPTNNYASLIPEFHECSIGGFAIGGGPPGTPPDPNNPRRQFCGGNFWDGRAEGNSFTEKLFPDGATKHIGEEIFYTTEGASILDPYVSEYAQYFGPTSDQALNPMPNPVEQNIQRQAVCEHVKASAYAPLYEKVWGVEINCSENLVAMSAQDVDTSETEFDISFKRLALAMGAFQASSDINSFSSKRDKALRAELACSDQDNPQLSEYYDPMVCLDQDYTDSPGKFPLVGLTEQENLGHDLFYNTPVGFGPTAAVPFPNLPVTNCSFCHLSDTTAISQIEGAVDINGDPVFYPDGTGLFERYTDDAYHNIGTPANPDVPGTPHPGISSHVGQGPDGFFKTPTMRNVDKRPYSRFVKAYTNNGWFKSLEGIVHFYNTASLGCESTDSCLDPNEPPAPGPPPPSPYAETTAATFGISPEYCPDNITSERRAQRANCWPEPAFPGAALGFLIGDLGMDAAQEAAVVAYLKTLTDKHTATPPTLDELNAFLNPPE